MANLFWEFKQPRITRTLKSLDPFRFEKLSFRLSDLVNAKVEAKVLTYPEEWVVFLYSVNCAALYFNFSLYDPSLPRQLPSGFRMDRPSIEIHDFSIYPRGQGLGTDVFFAFMESIPPDSFTSILLKAPNERSASFWSRFGFQARPQGERSSPAMSLDLTPPASGPKLQIRYK